MAAGAMLVLRVQNRRAGHYHGYNREHVPQTLRLMHLVHQTKQVQQTRLVARDLPQLLVYVVEMQLHTAYCNVNIRVHRAQA